MSLQAARYDRGDLGVGWRCGHSSGRRAPPRFLHMQNLCPNRSISKLVLETYIYHRMCGPAPLLLL